MTINSLENVGIVLADLESAVDFFVDLGLTVDGRTTVEGDWVDRTVGLSGVRCDLAVLQTRDGRGQLELMRFHSPDALPGIPDAPPHTLGVRRLAFSVDDLDAALARALGRGAELLGEVVGYEGVYKLTRRPDPGQPSASASIRMMPSGPRM